MNARYDEVFAKEARKTHNKKKDNDSLRSRQERSFWLFSLATFAETVQNAYTYAKESGSAKLITTIEGLKKFHDDLPT